MRNDRYMMATRAHTARDNDISRDEPSLAIIYGEIGDQYIGEWATGVGFVNVRFPKETAPEPLPPIKDDPVAKRLGIVRCCDLHGINCEPPSELCCRYCTEANHPDHPNVDCVLRQGNTGS